ncbi:sugar MFS transporter [Plantactinospora sp. BB1]|uniref:MFS transporter n=1 Tax=Plantactinospora sp. BB1 TaxID=2071627 RepID=UPI000D16FBA8|nr:MFS transporter [Plantactinospora sp. BB1]AVT37665.1 MFS transporter [Plantactinospora sp. BB1]
MSGPTRPGTPRLGRLAVLGAVTAFAMIGLQQALYGPAIPQLREAHGITAAGAATALSVHFAGAIIGVLAMPLARRLGVPDGRFLAWSLVGVAVGALAFPLAPEWPYALLAAFVAGVGFGGLDGGVNQVFTEVYAEGGHGMLNLLHGCFGAGAVAGPIAVGLLPGYGWSFAGCALLALLALPALRTLSGPVRQRQPADPTRSTDEDGTEAVGRPAGTADTAPGARVGARRPAFPVGTALSLGFLLFFVLHVGLETGAAGWETTHLIATGWSAAAAATATSGFWLAFTAARFAVVPLCRRYPARVIVFGCTGLTVLAAAATLVDPIAPVGYGLLGAAVGPLFPTGLAWLAEYRPGLTPTVVAVSMAGGIALPPAIGLAVGVAGPTAIAWAMVLMAVAGLGTVLGLARLRPAGSGPVAPAVDVDAAQV